MNNAARRLVFDRERRIYLIYFVIYFLAAFMVANIGIHLIKSSNAVYAQEAAAATESLSIPSISLEAPVAVIQYTGSNLNVPEQIAGSYSVHENKTLLFGHSSTIFSGLKYLHIGDTITYRNNTYVISSIEEKPKAKISMKDILQAEEKDTIVLMTCSGDAIPGTNGDHTHRLILTAEFKQPFIDGTVAGTDIHTGNMDQEKAHDHTYYGNGCSEGWGSGDTPTGSKVACSSRVINTYDNENLSIGTYYNYQAVTSGTGADLSAKNVPSSDTFCPLGWQLPYGGTDGDYYNQSKSWKYLLVQYGKDYVENNIATKNFLMSYPFSYIYTGNYIWGIYGVLMYYGIHGVYMSSSSYNSDRMDRFYLWGSKVNADSDTKTYGMSARCFHRRHGGGDRYLISAVGKYRVS